MTSLPKPHPIKPKLDGRHLNDRDSKLLKSFCSDIQGGHLEILQETSPKPWIEPKLGWRHRDSEFLKLFIWISKLAANVATLKIFKPHLLSSPKSNLVGGIGATRRFRIVKIIPFKFQDCCQESSNNISYQTLSRIVAKLDMRHRSKIENQNC